MPGESANQLLNRLLTHPRVLVYIEIGESQDFPQIYGEMVLAPALVRKFRAGDVFPMRSEPVDLDGDFELGLDVSEIQIAIPVAKVLKLVLWKEPVEVMENGPPDSFEEHQFSVLQSFSNPI